MPGIRRANLAAIGKLNARASVWAPEIPRPRRALTVDRRHFPAAKHVERVGKRSAFKHLANLHHADWLWPVSKTNADVLLDAGIDLTQIEIMPPAIE
jgi:hypothetical protein